ncbi:hypothetical protein BASA83_000311 [Batrachochytrium salamandrivorans]|nr:hypothetical protein BASA83_000311 [Batrachochytrium salamandrivorans]
MQSFSEDNDVTRPNQIDLTGSTMPRQTRERRLELVQAQAYHKVPVKTYSILQYTLPKLMKKRLGQDLESTGNALLFDRNCIFLNREKENLISDFKMCQSGIVLPDRKKGCAVHCLTVAIPRSKSVVDNHIEEMNLNACLTLDAWSNIRSKPIVNYMLISDSSTFFLESVLTGEQKPQCQMNSPGYGKND